MKKNKGPTLLSTWKNVKNGMDKFVKENNLEDVKKSVGDIVQKTQKDINGLLGEDLDGLKKKFCKEKKVGVIVKKEINKAKTFVNKQRNELLKLRKTIEKIALAKSGTSDKKGKKAVKKAAPVKKKASGKKTGHATNPTPVQNNQ